MLKFIDLSIQDKPMNFPLCRL